MAESDLLKRIDPDGTLYQAIVNESVRGGGRIACIIDRAIWKVLAERGLLRDPAEPTLAEIREKVEVAHLNGDATDNRLANLVICTRKVNDSHRDLHGTRPFGERHVQAKLTNAQAREAYDLATRGARHADVAARFHVSRATVSAIVAGDRYVRAIQSVGQEAL